jgi:hypothetical protein
MKYPPKISKAGQALIDADAIYSLKPLIDASCDSVLAQPTKPSPPLRATIGLSLDLANRLVQMGPLPSAGKTAFKTPAHANEYQISCDSAIGVWHEQSNPIKALKAFPCNAMDYKKDVVYLVLWALKEVQPAVYERLVGSVFGDIAEHAPSPCKAPAPIPYDEQEPMFEFRHGDVLGKHSIHPTQLVHTFISGATGVGKTYGGVVPLLKSFIAYSNAKKQSMGMLVIDPKLELLQICQTELKALGQPERLLKLGAGTKLQFFQPSCTLGVEDRYRMMAGLVQAPVVGDGAPWQEKGHRLNISMLQQDRLFYLQTGFNLSGVLRTLLDGVDHTHTSQWANLLALYKHALQSTASVGWLAAVSTVLMGLCPALRETQAVFSSYVSDAELLVQLFYRVSHAEKVCNDLSAQELAEMIDTDLFPNPQRSRSVSIEQLIAQGKVIVYQPSATYYGDIGGRVLKSRFFCDVLARQDMAIPVGYVADEFQRFITSDRETGEQSFLDRCRAYRVNCVLATQSLASLEHALIQNGENSPALVVDIIVANSPTKLIYRSSDTRTVQALQQWLPPAPHGRAHVAEVRPPAQLPVGLAYYLCNGDWGMYRYTYRPTA